MVASDTELATFLLFIAQQFTHLFSFVFLHNPAVDFHPTGDLLLVAGDDKHMRFFKIDGEKNEKQLSVRLRFVKPCRVAVIVFST